MTHQSFFAISLVMLLARPLTRSTHPMSSFHRSTSQLPTTHGTRSQISTLATSVHRSTMPFLSSRRKQRMLLAQPRLLLTHMAQAIQTLLPTALMHSTQMPVQTLLQILPRPRPMRTSQMSRRTRPFKRRSRSKRLQKNTVIAPTSTSRASSQRSVATRSSTASRRWSLRFKATRTVSKCPFMSDCPSY